MDFGLLGFKKKKLITSQINWLQVWLRMQLQTRAESSLCMHPQDRPESFARGGMERVKACLAFSPTLTSFSLTYTFQVHNQLLALSAARARRQCQGARGHSATTPSGLFAKPQGLELA